MSLHVITLFLVWGFAHLQMPHLDHVTFHMYVYNLIYIFWSEPELPIVVPFYMSPYKKNEKKNSRKFLLNLAVNL